MTNPKQTRFSFDHQIKNRILVTYKREILLFEDTKHIEILKTVGGVVILVKLFEQEMRREM